ncbi:unnamed protein product [Adineta steineri]|uniref:Uncharacterized protein n=3 Tax=Adineta steineri TaxID=433720 RepID=A0A819LVU5_9BILA|nr:unnamed protein product [Adineta steineri]CAF3970201.1 unnamed protein product [Adineta steineri]
MIDLTLFERTNETIFEIWNTTASGNSLSAIPSFYTGSYWPTQPAENLFDGNLATDYTNHGMCNYTYYDVSCGEKTGFYLTMYNKSMSLVAFYLGTNEYDSMRDPLSVTIEGSNLYGSELTFGSSWTLIYEGSSGLISDPGRSSFGAIQILPNNSMRFASYRFLVTSKRGSENSASYSEVRYERYRKFAYHMAQSGVKLFTIECVFASATKFGLPPQRFEVTRPGNPFHIQVVAPSIMWMKENLINVAAQRLPAYIDRIAWIDADVEFERLDWPYLTLNALERYPIVQMFKTGYITGPTGKYEILKREYSFAHAIRHGRRVQPHHSHPYAHPGYAWAIRRETFNAIGGLIDFCIVGSDDLHFAYALLGRIQETFPMGLHKDYHMVAKSWGDRVARIAGYGANVGYVDVNLYRRWHGYQANLSPIGRWLILSHYQFSPLNDLTRDRQSGVIYLANKRRLSAPIGVTRVKKIESEIVSYFISRNEDNKRVLPQLLMPQYQNLRGSYRRQFSYPVPPRKRPQSYIPIIQPPSARSSYRPRFY